MTIFLSSVAPGGWTLTVVSVCVVFSALIILYFIYSAIGNFSSGKWSLKPRRKASADVPSDEEAAAIALALALYLNGEDDGPVHDFEPGIITINQATSAWTDKTLSFRKLPRK